MPIYESVDRLVDELKVQNQSSIGHNNEEAKPKVSPDHGNAVEGEVKKKNTKRNSVVNYHLLEAALLQIFLKLVVEYFLPVFLQIIHQHREDEEPKHGEHDQLEKQSNVVQNSGPLVEVEDAVL